MLYTLLGGTLGGFLTLLYCKIFNIDISTKSSIIRYPANGQILIIFGIIFGAGIGFGFDTNYIMQKFK